MLKRRIKLFAPVLVLLFIVTSLLQKNVSAQEELNQEPGIFRSDKIEMIVKAGFGKLEVNSWTGCWTPFRISIANQGEAITGKLSVLCKTSNQNSQNRAFVKDIQLPTGSRQQHEISAFLSSSEDVEVNLISGGKTIASTLVKVDRQFGNDSQLSVAVIDNDSTTLNSITNMQIPRTNSRLPFQKVTPENSTQQQEQTADTTPQPAPPQNQNQQNRRRRGIPGQQETTVNPAVISPEEMPRDYVSYDSVDVVVINDAPLNQLTEDQARALKMWVASGGMLIVAGGVDVAGLRATGLDAILPVEAQGATSVPTLAELTDIYGQFDAAASLLVMNARVKPDAKIIIGTIEKVLVAEGKYGSGIVRFIAYNPKLNPYRSWNAGRHLWTDLLMPVVDLRSNNYWAGRIRRPSATVSWNSQNFLFKLADIKPTSSNYFLFFLLFYVLAVGPVNYFALKYMKKLDLAWVTIPAVVLLFTTASIIIAQTKRGGTVSSDMSFVEVHQADGIKETLTGLLIRPESKGTEDVKIDGRDAYATDSTQGPQNTVAEGLEATKGQANYLLKVPTANLTATILQIRSIAESKSPIVSMREEGNAVKIKNLSDAPLTYAVYVSAAGMSDAFSLAAGEEKQVALNAPQGIRFRDWYFNQLPQDSDEQESLDGLWGAMNKGSVKNNTKQQGFFSDELMTGVYKNLEHPILLGFADKAANSIQVESVAKRRSKSFYFINP